MDIKPPTWKFVAWFYATYTAIWIGALFLSIWATRRADPEIQTQDWRQDWDVVSNKTGDYYISPYATPRLPDFPCHIYYGLHAVYALPVQNEKSFDVLMIVVANDLAEKILTEPDGSAKLPPAKNQNKPDISL